MSAALVPQQEDMVGCVISGLPAHLGQRSSQGMLWSREGSWGGGGKGRRRGGGRTIVTYFNFRTQNF